MLLLREGIRVDIGANIDNQSKIVIMQLCKFNFISLLVKALAKKIANLFLLKSSFKIRIGATHKMMP